MGRNFVFAMISIRHKIVILKLGRSCLALLPVLQFLPIQFCPHPLPVSIGYRQALSKTLHFNAPNKVKADSILSKHFSVSSIIFIF